MTVFSTVDELTCDTLQGPLGIHCCDTSTLHAVGIIVTTAGLTGWALDYVAFLAMRTLLTAVDVVTSAKASPVGVASCGHNVHCCTAYLAQII